MRPKQETFADAGFEKYRKRTRRDEFLSEMHSVVPWSKLLALVEPLYPPGEGAGRPPVGLERMLRIHFLQHWFNLSDPAVEEALYDSRAMREFVGIDLGREAAPDETTVCKFRHLLEAHELGPQILATVNAHLATLGFKVSTGTIVDATIISAPSSTKNRDGPRDPEMHQTRKGNEWHFGMKAHIGVDAESGLVHSVIGTAANVNDVTQAAALLHGEETDAWGDAGYQGVDKRDERKDSKVRWEVAMRSGKRRLLNPERELDRLLEKPEKLKASIRAKVEHPFRLIKQQFGYAKLRYRGLAKITAWLTMLFALGNLWMARRQIIEARA